MPDCDGEPIRVCMVMPSFYPIVGGMETQVERIIPYLRERGIESSVVTRRTAGTSRRELHAGVDITRIAIPGGPARRSVSFTAGGSLNVIRGRARLDLIHAHSIMSPTTIAALAGTASRRPRVVTLHNTYEPEHLLSKPLGAARLHLYRRIIDRFICISSDIQQLLRRHGVPSSRMVAIPNGIDTTRFRPASAEERSRLRESRGISPDTPLAVFTGRLQPIKQVDVLLRAWARGVPGQLVILGDGDERDRLQQLARETGVSDRVQFQGIVNDVDEWVRAADAFVLPSRFEGLSVALLEAMASGAVPIATAIGGNTDVILPEHNGLLVPVSDVDALATSLIRVLNDSAWRQRLASQARETVVSGYDLNGIADRLAGLYREVLDDRS